jgi:hypothetical protein
MKKILNYFLTPQIFPLNIFHVNNLRAFLNISQNSQAVPTKICFCVYSTSGPSENHLLRSRLLSESQYKLRNKFNIFYIPLYRNVIQCLSQGISALNLRHRFLVHVFLLDSLDTHCRSTFFIHRRIKFAIFSSSIYFCLYTQKNESKSQSRTRVMKNNYRYNKFLKNLEWRQSKESLVQGVRHNTIMH